MSLPGKLLFPLSASALALVFITWLENRAQKRTSFQLSPRTTLATKLSQQEIANLPYGPDTLPGARDVETPYGTIKVFEWGPTAGRKVLFLHGISTPCIAFEQLAHLLVARGCRVMLFDLFGRGFSDTPLDLPHDVRLYTTQIMLVLASSPISWTGPSSFDLVGYSFGGGLAASFTRYFPHLVRSIIFVAPGGLVRTSHINWRSKFLYSIGIFPERLLEYLVKRRLSPSHSEAVKLTQINNKGDNRANKPAFDVESAITAEVRDSSTSKQSEPPSRGDNSEPMQSDRNLAPEAASLWQLENHPGFISAFMSSIRHGPIHDQHEDWNILGQHLKIMKNSPMAETEFPMQVGQPRALLALGDNDNLVLKDEVADDVKAALGEDNVQVSIIDGGHDFPISNAKDLANTIWTFWEPRMFLELLKN